VTGSSSARRALDEVLERALQTTDAFQSNTPISPLSQLCDLLSFREGEPETINCIIEYVEDSLARFVRQPYGFFDEVARAVIFDSARLGKVSSILTTMMHQWQYMYSKEPHSARLVAVSGWFCKLLARLAVIGEDIQFIEIMLEAILGATSLSVSSELWTLLRHIQEWSMFLHGTSKLKVKDRLKTYVIFNAELIISETTQVNGELQYLSQLLSRLASASASEAHSIPFALVYSFQRVVLDIFESGNFPKETLIQQIISELDRLRVHDKHIHGISKASLALTFGQLFNSSEKESGCISNLLQGNNISSLY
jgi:hypothetical protein